MNTETDISRLNGHDTSSGALGTTKLSIRLFGSFEVRMDGQSIPRLRSRKGQWLLALLALRAGRPIERAWLAGTLWPETTEENALVSLRQTLADLRQALGREGVRIASPTTRTLAFDPTNVFVDVLAFDLDLSLGDPASLKRAVELQERPLLEDCLEEWVLPEREVRARASLTARQILAGAALTHGDFATAISHLRYVIAADPYHEGARRDLMTALAQSGDWGAAMLTYRDLRLQLQRELRVEPATETRELYQHLRTEARRRADRPDGLAIGASPSKPTPLTAGVLPRPLTEMVGRDQEATAIGAHLFQSRMVTLTGPGGVGKTRLAIRVAEEWAEDQSDGVWFVDLAPLTDPVLVVRSVAAVLGIKDQPGSPLVETLTTALQDRHLLLILDNCEHLLDACVTLVSLLLMECPSLRLLTTSRQALRVSGETVWAVPSLSVPDPQDSLTPEIISRADSVRLFVERAAAVLPGFSLTTANAPAVVQICRQLDGIPLALELAAARTRLLAPEQIAERLDNRFQLLTQGSRAALPRHKTLRATVDWSYEMLSSPERRLLSWLSVFSGGWTLEAAETVCGPQEPDVEKSNFGSQLTVLDLLTELEEKSLVMVEMSDSPQRRYRLLETFRQYAGERLTESGQAEDARRRHRDWAKAFVKTAELHWRGPEAEVWITRLEADHDNLRTAMEGCERHEAGAVIGLELAASLWRFWMDHGHFREGLERLTRALAQAGSTASEKLRIKALNGMAAMAMHLGDFPLARRSMEEALPLARRSGNLAYLDNCLHNLGNVFYFQCDYTAARSLWEESLAIRREAEYHSWLEASLNNLGYLAYNEGDLDRAESLHGEALTIALEQKNRYSQHVAYSGLGNVAHMRGDFASAQSYFEQGLTIALATDDTDAISDITLDRGWLALSEGKKAEAGALFQAGLKVALKGELMPLVLNALDGFSEQAMACGDAHRATCLSSAAEARRETLLLPRQRVARKRSQAHVLHLREILGDAAFDAAWNKGRTLTLEQAVACALTSPCPPHPESPTLPSSLRLPRI